MADTVGAISSTAAVDSVHESERSPVKTQQVECPTRVATAAATESATTLPSHSSPRDSERSASSSAMAYGRKFPLGAPMISSLASSNRTGSLGEDPSSGNPLLIAIRREVGESEKRLTERLVRVERRIEQFRESFYTNFNDKFNEVKQWHPEYDRRLAQMEGGVEGVNEELSSLDRKLRTLEPRVSEAARRQLEEALSVKLEEFERHFQEHMVLHSDKVRRLQIAFDDLTGYTGRLATVEAQLEAHSEAHEQLRNLTPDCRSHLSGTCSSATDGPLQSGGLQSSGMGPSPSTEPLALEPGSLERREEATKKLQASTSAPAGGSNGSVIQDAPPVSEVLRCERMVAEAAESAEKAVRETERISLHMRQAQLQAEEQKARVLNLNERLMAQEAQLRGLAISSATSSNDVSGAYASIKTETMLENRNRREQVVQGATSLLSPCDNELRAEVDDITYKLDCHRVAIEEIKQVMDEKIWGKVKELERTLTMSRARQPCKDSPVTTNSAPTSPVKEETLGTADLEPAEGALLEQFQDMPRGSAQNSRPPPEQRGSLNSKEAAGSSCFACLPKRRQARS